MYYYRYIDKISVCGAEDFIKQSTVFKRYQLSRLLLSLVLHMRDETLLCFTCWNNKSAGVLTGFRI
jgi:hypothetical protein